MQITNLLNVPYTDCYLRAILSYIAQNKGKGDYIRVKEGIKDSYTTELIVMTLELLLTINGALYIFK